MDPQLQMEVNALHAQVCAALSDPRRILILYALSDGSKNVSDICSTLHLAQPLASRHLKVLREGGLVTARRNGMNVYYSLASPKIVRALDLLRQVLNEQLRHTAALVGNTQA